MASFQASPSTPPPRRRCLMAQPFKHPETGTYYIRRKVPHELRDALGREYKRSLGTKDWTLAKSRFTTELARSEEAFSMARAQVQGLTLLTQADAEQLASRWLRDEQAKLERSRAFTEWLAVGQTHTDERGEDHPVYITVTEYVDGDEAVWPEHVLPRVEAALKLHNVPMPKAGSEAHRWLMVAFQHELQRLSEWALARYRGDAAAMNIRPLPDEPIEVERKAAAAKKTFRRLRVLFASYSRDKVLNDRDVRGVKRTIKHYEAMVERFIELHGDLDITEITRDVVNAHRAALAQMPAKGEGIRKVSALKLIEKAKAEGLPLISEQTVSNGLRALSAMMSHGVLMGWLTENPVIMGGALKNAARAATRKQAATKKRTDYTPEELAAIFSSPVFTDPGWNPPRAKFGKAWYWLPLLLYYTGARREELAQLKVSEVAKSADGIWHLNIMATGDDDGERGVKTEGSRRRVPLHPDLVLRGFLGYVEGLPKGGQLFPMLKPNPAGYYGANFGKRWAEYLKVVVRLDSPVSPIHGFRHTFKTLCRGSGIAEDVQDAMTGHAGGSSVARGYGSMPLRTMAEALAKLPPCAATSGSDHGLRGRAAMALPDVPK
jgi:integrase